MVLIFLLFVLCDNENGKELKQCVSWEIILCYKVICGRKRFGGYRKGTLASNCLKTLEYAECYTGSVQS